jgi:hypothetical protein
MTLFSSVRSFGLSRVPVVAGLLSLATTSIVQPSARAANVVAPAPRALSGSRAISATVPAGTLGAAAGKRATVLLFVSPVCPITNQYAPQISALTARYAARGVRFVRVYSGPGATAETAKRHGTEYRIAALASLLDPTDSLADSLGATLTPEAFVLDAARTVRYAGRIDDRFADRGKFRTTGAAKHDLRDALDRVLAGRSVTVARTRAVGCAIERPRATITANGPTYAHDVAAVLQQNCISCHRTGEIGPMPLETYDQARRMAANIASVTAARQMPPWKPVPGCGEFVGERRLTISQVSLLKAWSAAGAPAGDLKTAPPEPQFAKGWTLGQPDLVLNMPASWHTAADAAEIYRCFVIPTGLTEDKQVVAIEYRPGNRSVVHHCLGYIDTQGRARKRDGADGKPGYTSFGGPGFLPSGELSGWAPGNIPQFLPDGIARPLPKGSDVILQVHYHPTGKPEDDRTQVGLYFARKPITKTLRTIPLIAGVDIPAGDASYATGTTMNVPFNADIVSVMPHMHLLGKTMDMKVTLPDGTIKPLIKIDDWDFNWQGTYVYKQAMHIPKGSTISLRATYDNSSTNPRNPHSPPQPVKWGEKTTDEMCIGFISYTVDNEDDPTIRFLDKILGGGHKTASR